MNTKQTWQPDTQFFIASLAAVIYWITLYQIVQPATNLAWPLSEPIAFLLPCFIYPIVEEIVFRGLVQDEIGARLVNCRLAFLTCANVITSLIFTGLHFINHPPLWALAVFIPSLVFGYFKDRSGSLFPPILLHIFYNSGYFLIFTHQI
ncbi:MAG: JDVT-CTERM system glutamic-type intramembrane protease [Gammaproteobacteria bacterium]